MNATELQAPPEKLPGPLFWQERDYVLALQVWVRAVRTCPHCLMPRRVEQFSREPDRCDDCRILRMVMASAEAARSAGVRADRRRRRRAQDDAAD